MQDRKPTPSTLLFLPCVLILTTKNSFMEVIVQPAIDTWSAKVEARWRAPIFDFVEYRSMREETWALIQSEVLWTRSWCMRFFLIGSSGASHDKCNRKQMCNSPYFSAKQNWKHKTQSYTDSHPRVVSYGRKNNFGSFRVFGWLSPSARIRDDQIKTKSPY